MPARRFRALAVSSLILAAGPAAAAEPRPTLAVIDLVAAGASPSLASAAGGVVGTELDRLQVFKVITSEAIRGMLALERQKMILGACSGGACATDIGSALGADYLVSGKVTAVGGTGGAPARFSLELVLSNVKKGTQEGQSTETAPTEAQLMTLVPRSVGKLTSKLLASRSGRLVVVVSEAAAVVKVDEQARGTTPLPGPLTLPSGPRALSVEKDGFVAWQADVTVQPGRIVEERVNMVPSPDFIRSYESRAGKMRLGAWAGTGAAVLGAAAFAVFQYRASQLYGNSTTDGTFLYYKQKLVDGAAPPAGADASYWRGRAQSLQNQVNTAQNLSYIGGGLAAVGAGVAAWMWIGGDDPHKYDRYRGTALEVAPLPGGAAVAVAGNF
ncbi:MAG TPA: PEGA domain-containing protein [Anaeromyxobacteraceae bacterium]|jgi:hypothetical protein